MSKAYTISVYTENNIGLLSRITLIFTRRHINIESLTVSHSEIEGVSRFTIVVVNEEEKIQKLVNQIEKQVEVIAAFYHSNSETVFQEIALIKVSTQQFIQKQIEVENIIRDANASIISLSDEFVVIEKTGHEDETEVLYQALKPFGVLQFVRSGRVSISRDTMPVSTILKNFELKKQN